MTAGTLLSHLRAAGAILTATGTDRLRVDAPKGVLTPDLRASLVAHKAELLATLRVRVAQPYELNEFNRRKGVRNAAPKRRSVKVWRPAPYWQACVEATMLPSGGADLEAADHFYAALALREGHTLESVAAMLQLISPMASTAPAYSAGTVSQAQANLTAYLTQECIERYILAHPFAWELRLDAAALMNIQVVEGVQ